MNVKKVIAHNVVTIYHGPEAATLAADYFYRNVQARSSAVKDHVERSLSDLTNKGETISALRFCTHKLA